MGRRVIGWRGMALITAAFFAVFAIAMFGILSSRRNMEAQARDMQQEIVVKEQSVTELKADLARVGTDEYVENEAREKYDYVKSGEMRFVFSDPEKLKNYTPEEWQIIMEEDIY